MNNNTTSIPYETVAKALFDNYESIYMIDVDTFEWKALHESNQYLSYNIERKGNNFTNDSLSNIKRVISDEDRSYVLRMLSKSALIEGVTKDKYYGFVYRIKGENPGDEGIYHQIRATLSYIDGKKTILMGIRNIDNRVDNMSI